MALGGRADAPHLPRPAPIDAYGDGGFRFAGMSHRGSLLCFPDGIWAWPVNGMSELNAAALSAAFERAESLDFFLIGAGRDPWALPNICGSGFANCRYRSMQWRQALQCELTTFFWRKTGASVRD